MRQNYDPLCTDHDRPSARIEGLFERWYDRHPTHSPDYAGRALSRRQPIDPASIKNVAARYLGPKTEPNQVITPELRSAVLALVGTNLLYKEIAARLGMNRSTVQKIANHAGYRRRHQQSTRLTRAQAAACQAEVARLAAADHTQQQIANILGITRARVAYYHSARAKTILRPQAAA